MSKFNFLRADRPDGGEAPRGARPSLPRTSYPTAPFARSRGAFSEALVNAYENLEQGWFWATNAAGQLVYLSQEAITMLGAGDPEGGGPVFSDLFAQSSEESEAGRSLSFAMLRHSTFTNLVAPNVRGELRWWSVSGIPRFDDAGTFSGYCGCGVDITSQREFSENATRMAMHDPLTQLPNRLRMAQVLDAHLSKYHLHKRPCAILLIDLDRFKQVNDTLGHPAGDVLLKLVSQRLVRIVGDRDCVFRLGGDEFKVFARNMHDREGLEAMGNEIIAALSEPYSIDGKRCIIGASVGIAVCPEDGVTADSLTRNADLALYASKASGRGCTRFFTSEMLDTAKDRRGIEEDIRDALANGEFEVHYQPIVSCLDNHTTGVEALVRWNHPTRGRISPEIFIPIAEEANLVSSIGEWVLRQACEDAAKWPGKIRVAVNISPIQFTSGLLPSLVVSALSNSGLEANRLELEITEGVFLSNSEDTDQMFETLKRIGVRLALDDFGTGYSSLGYLRTAPFDKIKIDKSFVRAATLPGSRNAAIIAAIVALAQALGMETTAEGIETQDQLDLIRNLQVSHVQGYIYSKPVPHDEVSERLGTGTWEITPDGPSNQRSDRRSVYRKVTAIFGNHCRTVLIRNLSQSGALIEGLDNVPVGSKLIVDLGEGELVFARIVRSQSRLSGVQFESPLERDDEGRLHSKSRVSKLLLRSIGIPANRELNDAPHIAEDNAQVLERVRAKLGMARASSGASESSGLLTADASTPGTGQRTLRTLARNYLESICSDRVRHSAESELLKDHILPWFGDMSPDQITVGSLSDWFASTSDNAVVDQASMDQMRAILRRLNVSNVDDVAGVTLSRRATYERHLSEEEVRRLTEAVAESHSQQLKYVISLLMLTGVRQRDLIEARWEHFDLRGGIWNLPIGYSGKTRQVRLPSTAIDVISEIPRLEGCSYLFANPKTGKPYMSFASSWQTVVKKADLPGLDIDDVRNCIDSTKAAPLVRA